MKIKRDTAKLKSTNEHGVMCKIRKYGNPRKFSGDAHNFTEFNKNPHTTSNTAIPDNYVGGTTTSNT